MLNNIQNFLENFRLTSIQSDLFISEPKQNFTSNKCRNGILVFEKEFWTASQRKLLSLHEI
jgi:hypothetical protein